MVTVNRKQKKAKRLKANQHTRTQARYKPTQPVVFNRQSAEACLAQNDVFDRAVHEVAKKKLGAKLIIAGLVFWVLMALAIIW